MVYAVQQARKLKSVKIVSFDWLEDSLLKKSAKREGEYLMNNRTKSTAQKKEKKKMVRKANVKKSSECTHGVAPGQELTFHSGSL